MTDDYMKIGELAKRTGITVRTLRYYDEIGLLSPTERMESGYRIYGPKEIERLQRIISLRHLGLSLKEILTSLKEPGFSPLPILLNQLQQLEQQMALQKRLHHHLEMLVEYVQRLEKISVDELIKTIRMMKKQEQYFTTEQQDYLEGRRKKIGEEQIREVEQEWTKLIAEVRTEIKKGTDPSNPEVQKLAKRWQNLLKEFTGGNEGIKKSLNMMYTNEDPEEVSHGAFDQAVMDYMVKAMKVSKKG